jgi:hypothetical protein
MIRKSLLACALPALTVGAAVGQDAAKQAPFNANNYPPVIRRSFDAAVKECREADDGKVTFAADTVRTVDLTGDGRQDFIVSLENTECSTFESVFCGTGGCSLDIYVALPDGNYRNVFSNVVRGYKILPGKGKGKGPRTIRFDMHGGYCNTYGPAECYKQRRITDQPFAFKDR